VATSVAAFYKTPTDCHTDHNKISSSNVYEYHVVGCRFTMNESVTCSPAVSSLRETRKVKDAVRLSFLADAVFARISRHVFRFIWRPTHASQTTVQKKVKVKVKVRTLDIAQSCQWVHFV